MSKPDGNAKAPKFFESMDNLKLFRMLMIISIAIWLSAAIISVYSGEKYANQKSDETSQTARIESINYGYEATTVYPEYSVKPEGQICFIQIVDRPEPLEYSAAACSSLKAEQSVELLLTQDSVRLAPAYVTAAAFGIEALTFIAFILSGMSAITLFLVQQKIARAWDDGIKKLLIEDTGR